MVNLSIRCPAFRLSGSPEGSCCVFKRSVRHPFELVPQRNPPSTETGPGFNCVTPFSTMVASFVNLRGSAVSGQRMRRCF
jgi:hypothetical protein